MKTVLVIDDDKIIRDYYEAMIGMLFPVNVLTADDGDTCIKIMEEHPEVDLIILDLQIKRMSGWELYPRLRKIKNDVRAIVASAYIYDDVEKKLKEMGVDAILRKPFYPTGFGDIVRNLLEL